MSSLRRRELRTVLFVGAGRHQRRAIRRAKELGLEVAAIDRNPDAPAFADADVAEVVDFGDVPAAIEAARRIGPDGVLTVSSDRAVPVVAAIAGARPAGHRPGSGPPGDEQAGDAATARGGRRPAAAVLRRPHARGRRCGTRRDRPAGGAQAGRLGRPARPAAHPLGRPAGGGPGRRARGVAGRRGDPRALPRRDRGELPGGRPRRRRDRADALRSPPSRRGRLRRLPRPSLPDDDRRRGGRRSRAGCRGRGARDRARRLGRVPAAARLARRRTARRDRGASPGRADGRGVAARARRRPRRDRAAPGARRAGSGRAAAAAAPAAAGDPFLDRPTRAASGRDRKVGERARACARGPGRRRRRVLSRARRDDPAGPRRRRPPRLRDRARRDRRGGVGTSRGGRA